ncbi:MAG: heavy metal translocating P-type ATPase [Polyangia bacterium]
MSNTAPTPSVSAASAGFAIDPICKMKVNPAAPKGGSFEFQGTTYYFCNPKCNTRFAADPERYLAPEWKGTKGMAAPAATDARYVCPMDPEIDEAQPGDCRICGMALEPDRPLAAGATDDAAGPQGAQDPELRAMTRRFVAAAALALPVLLLAMGPMLLGRHPGGLASALAQAGLTTLVLVAGLPLWQRGVRSFVARRLNMFSLITLGVLAAYGYSTAALLARLAGRSLAAHGDGLYFESAAVITALVLLGQVLELRARHRTGEALRGLLRLVPRTARRLFPDGTERDVPIAEIFPGHRVRVLPGQQVPADGVVLEGRSSVDESLLSGESLPVEKAAGARVAAGTVNGAGTLVCRVTGAGETTLLSQIVRLVSAAQRSRAPVQRVADQVAAYFVPAVLAVALVALVAWLVAGGPAALSVAVTRAVAVLIIACPCALGLATPMSILVATGRGAQAGILLRSAEALERLARVDTLVLDKTGTLTAGRPELLALRPADGVTEDELLRTAASLEQGSEHPLAGAILAAARTRGLPLTAVLEAHAEAGRGLHGQLRDGEGQGSRDVVLGTAELCAEHGAVVPPAAEAELAGWQAAGRTVVHVAVGGAWRGALAVADPIRETTAPALRELEAEGLRLLVASGDSPEVALGVARTLGLAEGAVHARLLPGDKADLVRRLREEGRIVAMAGDGVNDAPALALADVGVAMATGTDLANQSAGLTLLGGDLRGLVRARRLSRATLRNIRQNLAFAFLYNALGVPVAAGLLYPLTGWQLSPMLASAAMSLSSVCVISNALRLRRVAL